MIKLLDEIEGIDLVRVEYNKQIEIMSKDKFIKIEKEEHKQFENKLIKVKK